MEFALVLPILLVVLCGIIDFGWILSCQNELTNAAGETARYAAIYANSSDVHTLAEEFLTAQGITGTPHLDSLTIDDTYATVEVSEEVPYLTGLTGVFTRHNTITLHGKASMPIEPYETEEETEEDTDPETEPETTPPGTSGVTPEPSEPETSEPETSEPETSAPETSAPETSEAPASGRYCNYEYNKYRMEFRLDLFNRYGMRHFKSCILGTELYDVRKRSYDQTGFV